MEGPINYLQLFFQELDKKLDGRIHSPVPHPRHGVCTPCARLGV